MYIRMYMSIPVSQPIPHSLSVTRWFLHTWLYVCFVDKFTCIIFFRFYVYFFIRKAERWKIYARELQRWR